MSKPEFAEEPMQRTSVIDAADGEEQGPRRRDFINIAALSFAGVGGAIILIPLVNQMNPSADVLALASIEVDISKIPMGSGIKVAWRKQPVFVRYLAPAEIAAAIAVDIATLRDPQTLEQRTKPGHTHWLITMAICTHLGCVPLGITPRENRGTYGGYFCPCHGSQYDTAARIRSGPAPRNLFVPDYSFKTATSVQIGA